MGERLSLTIKLGLDDFADLLVTVLPPDLGEAVRVGDLVDDLKVIVKSYGGWKMRR